MSAAEQIDETFAAQRHRAVLDAATRAGLMGGETSRIGARVRKSLLQQAKKNTGISSDTELLEYALAALAIEDDFGAKLLARKGSVPRDLDLEF